LQKLGDRRSTRVAYCDGTLEIITPLPEHDYFNETIGDASKDMVETLEPPWQERKLRYMEIIRHATPEIRRVSLADKWLQFGRDRQQTL